VGPKSVPEMPRSARVPRELVPESVRRMEASPPEPSPLEQDWGDDRRQFVATQAPLDGARVSYADGALSTRQPITKIGRYALFGQFAAGGMATVHFGRLDGAGGFSRVVAIKRLLPHLVEDPEFTEMLLKEARLAARVRHPNVVPTLDVVASKGDVLLVLEYVNGEALGTLCRIQAKERKQFIPIEVATSIMHDTLQGLHAIHEAVDEKGRLLGLIHRDISPPNVIVGADGMARVLDFGIAKALQQREESVPNRLKGKSGYMSPEQVRGDRLTRRSDVFAAGIILWELLTLRRLFSAKTESDRMSLITQGGYKKPSDYRQEIRPPLDNVTMKALALDPDERFATVRDFVEALEKAAPSASARVVADWVSDLARESLAERARLVAQVEIWDGGFEPGELSSSPFSAEAVQQIGSDYRGPQPATPTPISKIVPAPAPPAPRRYGLLALLLVALALAAAYVLLHEVRIG
ncbi:MAG TPA: serine/threonine-protein kinase, partial [Polyangium sp.]|nr:serine/threonine-protein kinase [Polyangium sp.]